MESMVGRVPGLLDFNYGPYDSAEGLNDDYTHGFIMTFESPEARDEYLPRPVHEEVKDVVVPNLARVVVFDFNMPELGDSLKRELEVRRAEEERELAVGGAVFNSHQDFVESFVELDELKAFVQIPVAQAAVLPDHLVVDP